MTTQQHLLDRAYGFTHNDALKRATATSLIYALQPAGVTFSQRLPPADDPYARIPAHIAGVNALTIDRFEGRYLLSGGADSSIAIWDLEAQTASTESGETYLPLSAVNKTAKEHKLGITQLSFYPFDSLAFLTSSYDHTVKLYSSETLEASASFDLDAVIYNIALSPIASHLLVACATQGPNVRLIDLRSGATTHSLAGHAGAVLSTAWSPVTDHLLASGATDGTVRFWDIRRSVGSLGSLNLEDSVGRIGAPTHSNSHAQSHGQAHRGAVNGIVWTEDGRHLVTAGHDQRIRVWDTSTYANTLANFGPMVKNSGLAPTIPIVPPRRNLPARADVVFYPNEHEILFYELFDGKLLRRMRRPEVAKRAADVAAANSANGKGQRNAKDRITSLAWRAHDVEMYSAHADGSICAWKPRTDEDVEADEEERVEEEERDKSRKRKRDVLDDIYAGLTKKNITFGNMGL
ncbi:WD40 repeat-like protein [Macroventuria anomochaeta]|uniref:WD40 repeat-like protein n=1 Tax=Macroventuria anomochaeta TaxID=301207 RepID=A0ACB6S937_9PLEO|nr:WD40 repeat-like protein [Macroventuria anomochaeta]KAF2630801.1 WD40 repeat-like protein [Macroventuria anomochaeta]